MRDSRPPAPGALVFDSGRYRFAPVGGAAGDVAHGASRGVWATRRVAWGTRAAVDLSSRRSVAARASVVRRPSASLVFPSGGTLAALERRVALERLRRCSLSYSVGRPCALGHRWASAREPLRRIRAARATLGLTVSKCAGVGVVQVPPSPEPDVDASEPDAERILRPVGALGRHRLCIAVAFGGAQLSGPGGARAKRSHSDHLSPPLAPMLAPS